MWSIWCRTNTSTSQFWNAHNLRSIFVWCLFRCFSEKRKAKGKVPIVPMHKAGACWMMRYITARVPGCNKAGRTRSSLWCNAHSTDSGQSVLSRHGILAHRSACFGRSGIRAHHVRPSGIDYIFSCVSVLFCQSKYIVQPSRQTSILTANKITETAKVLWIPVVKVKYRKSTMPDNAQVPR